MASAAKDDEEVCWGVIVAFLRWTGAEDVEESELEGFSEGFWERCWS